jgi:membrane associated rhomboid family serine protease
MGHGPCVRRRDERPAGGALGEGPVIPLSDDPVRRGVPVVTILLIMINVLVFLYEMSLGSRLDGFVQAFGAVPREITTGRDLPPMAPLGNVYLTLITSMFLHGGWLHLGGNMLYLWVFGDNVEDTFGSFGYLLFYLVCGLAATVLQIAMSPGSDLPSIGASGAIAGVLGAYIVMFPTAQVRTLLILGFFILIPRIPALFLIGAWFLLQLLSGLGQLGIAEETGGVAFWAHVGGFVAGLLLALFLRPRTPQVAGGVRSG